MPVVSVVLVGLVVLAGCSTFGTVGTEREPFDVEPTTVPDRPSNESTPVVAFDPVTNSTPDPWVLLNAHFTALEGRAYTVDYTFTERRANGTPRVAESWRTTYGSDHTTIRQTRTIATQNGTVTRQLYSNGSDAWSRTISNNTTGNATRYLVEETAHPVPPTDALLNVAPTILKDGLESMNVTSVQALDTVPSTVDEPVFLIEGTAVNLDAIPGTRKRSNLSVFVTESGQVVEYHQQYSYVEDGERIYGELRLEYRVYGVGEVEPPDWVPSDTNDTTIVLQSSRLDAQHDGFSSAPVDQGDDADQRHKLLSTATRVGVVARLAH